MKKLLYYPILLLLLTVFCLGAVIPVSAECTDADSATLSGKGVLYVPADTVTISFSIETCADSQEDAQKQNAAVTEKIKSACAGLGCLNEDSFYSYSDPCSGKFIATRCMTITTGKINSVASITQKLTDSGATGINYTCYIVKNLKPYQDKVLKLAIEDAENKAIGLGLQLKLSSINDLGCYSYYDGKCDQNGNKLVSVECNVSVLFERK
jgi:uncharacterized protein YggE